MEKLNVTLHSKDCPFYLFSGYCTHNGRGDFSAWRPSGAQNAAGRAQEVLMAQGPGIPKTSREQNYCQLSGDREEQVCLGTQILHRFSNPWSH